MTQLRSSSTTAWLNHLSLRRIVVSSRFIPEVDGFRFLAILIVVLSHIIVQCNPPLGGGLLSQVFLRITPDGKRGVYLFFTISGFILALPFARHHLTHSKPVNLRSYFRRRITRLEPPYILVMVVRAAALLPYKGLALSVIGVHLLASLFYAHGLVFGYYSTINPPTWSLEVEIQFYILAPLLTTIFMLRSAVIRRTLLVAIILTAGLSATLFIDHSSRLALTLANYFQYFAAGFLLCDLYLSKNHLSLPPVAWDAVGVAALAWILLSNSYWSPAILPFIALALYMAGFFGIITRRVFSMPFISIVGGMCYSIYLTHSSVMVLVHNTLSLLGQRAWPPALQDIAIYTMSLTLVLAVGAIYFVLIERPCMQPDWPQKLLRWMRRGKQIA